MKMDHWKSIILICVFIFSVGGTVCHKTANMMLSLWEPVWAA